MFETKHVWIKVLRPIRYGSNIINILRIVFEAVEYEMEGKEGVYRFAKDGKSFIDEFEKQLKIAFIEKKRWKIFGRLNYFHYFYVIIKKKTLQTKNN